MGNGASARSGKLSKKDMERLQRRFNRLAQGRGRVGIPEFQSMVEMGGNPFVPHIFKLFDKNGDNTLTLEEFNQAIEYFGQLDNQEEQYRFAFSVYDQDRDGFISATELYNSLQGLLGTSVPEAQLEQVVYNTMSEFDRDGDNKLDFEEFKQLLSASDLANKFALTM